MTAQEAIGAREWARDADDSQLAAAIATGDRTDPLYLAALVERNYRKGDGWVRGAQEGNHA